MPFCAVAKCTSSNKTKACQEEGISFFSFPKCYKMRMVWEHKCYRRDPINIKTSRICSKHFKEEDMDPSCMMKRSLGVKCLMRLKVDAVPSQNLPYR